MAQRRSTKTSSNDHRPTTFLTLPCELRQKILALTVTTSILNHFKPPHFRRLSTRTGLPGSFHGFIEDALARYDKDRQSWAEKLRSVHPDLIGDVEYVAEKGWVTTETMRQKLKDEDDVWMAKKGFEGVMG